MTQKTFNLKNKQEFTFNTYICPETNPNLLHPVYNFLAAGEKEYGNILFLWGDSGSGKSHLLHAITNYMSKIGSKVFYSCLKHPAIIKPDIFEQLENFNLICLDDIDHVLPLENWQEALYYCLELTENYNTKLIVSSNDNINQITTARAETYSRLAASFRHQVQKLNEKELFLALKRRASFRQIPISENVLNFIQTHSPRDSKSLFSLLDKLEEQSLVMKKSISIRMVKDIIEKKL